MLRTVDRSQGLHQRLCGHVSVGTLSRDQTSPLFGRLIGSLLLQSLLSLCRTLGIVINEKKLDLVPSQTTKYLGMTIDTEAGKVFPSLARVEKFLSVAESFCTMDAPPAQLWQVILGHLASLEWLVPHGRLRMRSLQWHLKAHWSPKSDPPSLTVPLPQEMRRDLSRWMVRDHLLMASVHDGIPPKFLKEFAGELAPVLCRLFHLIVISCTYPSWKHALVQPVPKKGDHSNPSNYCPIALTSTVAKVFKTLLHSHFIKQLESNNLLSGHQYGFHKARSTGDLLSYLPHAWSSSLRNFRESLVVDLDISKAFDRIWHKALLAKLPAFGFTPSFCKRISSFLFNRFISVGIDSATSASFPISRGVPQGSLLSPTHFLLFINYLHTSASDVHSFANDSTVHKSSSFQCQPSSNTLFQSCLAMFSTINSDLKSISELGTRNLVKFITSKTQLLALSLCNTPSNFAIIFEDSKMPPCNSVNILELQISSCLSWRDCIVQIAKSASKKFGVLFWCKQCFNSAQLFKLYTGFIHPCMDCCSHIWGSSPYTSLLDRVESKAIRLIGDSSLTSTPDPMSLHCLVASVLPFYRHYFGRCSDELAACTPLQWLGHVPHGRHHFPTAVVWHSTMQELIGSVMVSSLLLPTFGTLSLLLYFWLPSTFPSKGRSITTLGTRWHDFFYYPFRYFIDLFNSFQSLSLPFLKGCRLGERAHCSRSVFSIIKKKRKKK